MARAKQSQEIFEGTVVGNWTVINETPTRGAKGLMWTCACTQDHHIQIAHHDLQFSVVPTQCAECVEAESAARAAIKVEERRLVAEWRAAQQLAHKEAQQEVQEKVNV